MGKNDEDHNASISPEDDKPKEKDPMAALLNRLLANQEKDAAERAKESKELKDKIDKSEKSMSDQITLANDNVKVLIEETRREFKADIDRVNQRLDKQDEENGKLIREAIEANNLRLEARLAKLEEKGEKEKGCR